MRRPGNFGGHFWFGNLDKHPTRSFIDAKLAEIAGAKKKNGTPLTEHQKNGRLKDVLRGAKPKNITG